MHFQNTAIVEPRKIMIWRTRNAVPTFINILSRYYEPLQYPLLSPYSTPGWYSDNRFNMTQRVWYKCRLLTETRFQVFGNLIKSFLFGFYLNLRN